MKKMPMHKPSKADPDHDGDAGKSESNAAEAKEAAHKKPPMLKDADKDGDAGMPETPAEEATPAERLMHRDMQRMAARKSGPKVI